MFRKIFFGILSFLLIGVSFAQPEEPSKPTIIPSPPGVSAKSYLLMDAGSGQILAEKNVDEKLHPASLTKIMTLYLISKELKNGSISLDSKVNISKNAWSTSGSKMFVKVGSDVLVKDLIQGIIVSSGNDATVAMAEYAAGSTDSFVEMMNMQSEKLGMTNTHFVDVIGLTESEDHYSTARDLGILSRALILDYPKYYEDWYKQKWFVYNNIRQPNRNRLLWRYNDADGIKTGHTDKAGFCLVSSAKRDGMRLISVVLGSSTDEKRSSDSISLLNYGFRFYRSYLVYQGGSPIRTPRVWFGASRKVAAGVLRDLYVTVPVGQFQEAKTKIIIKKNVKAPITKGQELGSIIVMLGDKEVKSEPLVALSDNPKGGFFRSMFDHLVYLFYRWF